jgi:hypothetical protein
LLESTGYPVGATTPGDAWEKNPDPYSQQLIINYKLPRTNDGATPDRYFYFVDRDDRLEFNYHIHEMAHEGPEAWVVALECKFTIDPCARFFRNALEVKPLRFDVVSRGNPQQQFDITTDPSEIDLGPWGEDMPDDDWSVDVVGDDVLLRRVYRAPEDGYLICAAGHLHMGGQELTLYAGDRVHDPSSGTGIVRLSPGYYTAGGGTMHSHVYWMESRSAPSGVPILANRPYTVEARYKIAEAVTPAGDPWYPEEHDRSGAMGLMVVGMTRNRPRQRPWIPSSWPPPNTGLSSGRFL